MQVAIVTPESKDSFWALLLGKGYPSPNQSFRWCTDRLKIKPATKFLTSLSTNNKSILMLLGVRSDESQTRAESIEKRSRNHRGLVKHNNVPNAFVLSPVKHWTNPEVWSFLSTYKAPWGSYSDMMKLYDKGSGETDCNIALNPESPSCGKTRFGCWVCTVVSKDKSMENMLKHEEDQWMKPLHDFRNMLEEYRYDHSTRQTKRRNGQKAVGPYTPQTNGMVERVNGTIKNTTIKAEDYESIYDVKKDLNKFLIYYNFNRRHGSLRKELKVRTPFDAVQSWFQTKPEIFKILPNVFQNIALEMVQRGET